MPSLRRNFSWTFAGNIVYVLCQWGMLTAIAKLGNPEMVGQFALGLAIASPVILLSNLGLRQIQATDAGHQHAFRECLTLRLATTSLALLLIVSLAFAGYRMETALVIFMIAVAKSFESISDVFFGLLQQHESMDRIAKSMIIKGLLSLTVFSLTIYFTDDVFWGTVGLAVTWAMVLFFYDVRSGAWILRRSPSTSEPIEHVRPSWKSLVRLGYLTLPLGIVATLGSLNANVPRYVLEHYLGERELGIYAALAYVIVAGNVVVNALNQSSIPRLARHYADRDLNAFGKLIFRLSAAGFAIGVSGVSVAAIAGGWILAVLYTPEYSAYVGVFVWLSVAASLRFVAAFLSAGITAARYFRAQVPLFGAVVAVTAAGSLALVPQVGIVGAALALVLGTMLQLAGNLGILLYVVKVAWPKSNRLE